MENQTKIIVCTNCKKNGVAVGAPVLEKIKDSSCTSLAEIVEVGCLGACSQAANLVIQTPGKWQLLLSNLSPEVPMEDLYAAILSHQQNENGQVPKPQRKPSIAGNFAAKIPPL